jgi:hypothetical protein
MSSSLVNLRNTLAGVALLGTAVAGTYEYRTRDRALPPAQPATRYLVRIEERALWLDGKKICELSPLQEQAQVGAGASCKAAGKEPNLYLDSLGRALPPLGKAGALHQAEIKVDPRTPYRVLLDVLFTLAQRGVDSDTMVVPDGPSGDQLTFTYLIPSSQAAPPQPLPPLLVVTLEQAGVSLGLRTGATTLDKHTTRIGPGCADGDGIALPSSTPVDYGALVRCVFTLQGRIRARSAPSGSLDVAELVAAFNIPALSILRVVSSLSCGSETCLRTPLDGGPTLLTHVEFGVPKEGSDQDTR